MEKDELQEVPKPYQNLARVIGMDATLRLCREYGGEVLYIPKLDRMEASQRREDIRQEWNGRNNAELARKYGVSIRSIQKAVEGLKEPEVPGQITLEELL